MAPIFLAFFFQKTITKNISASQKSFIKVVLSKEIIASMLAHLIWKSNPIKMSQKLIENHVSYNPCRAEKPEKNQTYKEMLIM